jgi:hypothetical protein
VHKKLVEFRAQQSIVAHALEIKLVYGLEDHCRYGLLDRGPRALRHSSSAYSTSGRERHKAPRDYNYLLKRAFWLAARGSALHDPLAKAYFNQCKHRVV